MITRILWEAPPPFDLHSFPRSAWECRPGRSASSSRNLKICASRDAESRRRGASKTAFPRRTVGTSGKKFRVRSARNPVCRPVILTILSWTSRPETHLENPPVGTTQMATERQIEANRRNAERSCGPTSPAGKARSRANATKHGMAGESAEVEAGFSPEFEARRARWAVEQQPVGEAGNFALDRVVASTFRIERCERSIDNHMTDVQQRAKLAWDEDRAVEA